MRLIVLPFAVMLGLSVSGCSGWDWFGLRGEKSSSELDKEVPDAGVFPREVSSPDQCSDNNDCTDETVQFWRDPVTRKARYICKSQAFTPAGAPCTVQGASGGKGTCDGQGQCVPPKPQCDDGDPCTIDSSDGAQGCIHAPSSGAACDDGNLCTANDVCTSGKCIGKPMDCSDGNQCHTNRCEPTTGKCVVGIADQRACNDGNVCTIVDTCIDGVCRGQAMSCDDHNSCTEDSCDASFGCVHKPLSGQPCNDSLACTQDDMCVEGKCQGRVTCDDRNACTTESCERFGCFFKAISCDDQDDCTKDSCDPSAGCLHETTVASDSILECKIKRCDPQTGAAIHDAPVGTPCRDGEPSNGDELCGASGKCFGATLAVPVTSRVPWTSGNVAERRLGFGRHPLAANELGMAAAFLEVGDRGQVGIGVATFSPAAEGRGLAQIANASYEANPVLAALPDGSFALVHASLRGAGQGLRVHLSRVSADGRLFAQPKAVDENATFGQSLPDIVWTGSQVLVAWEDESLADRRQICKRSFSAELEPVSARACEGAPETTSSRVVLASAYGQVAEAWREDSENEARIALRWGSVRRHYTLTDRSGTSESPALTFMDATRVLLVYSDGENKQVGVVIDNAAPDIGPIVLNENGESTWREPALATTRDGVFLAMRGTHGSQSTNGNPFGEQTWIHKIQLVASAFSTWPYMTLAGSMSKPGRESGPTLAATPISSSGAVFAAWNSLSREASGVSHGDVLISLMLTPLTAAGLN